MTDTMNEKVAGNVAGLEAPNIAGVELTLVHNSPGRLRFRSRSASVTENSLLPEHLRQELAKIQGVVTATVNPRTGSLLVEYDPAATTTGKIVETIVSRGITVAGKGVFPSSCCAGHGQEDLLSGIGSWLIGTLAERLILGLIGSVA